MEIFTLTLSQMLMMFALMALGFLLHKLKILPENADSVMARLETYVFSPALTLSALIASCTVKTFAENPHSIRFMFYFYPHLFKTRNGRKAVRSV